MSRNTHLRSSLRSSFGSAAAHAGIFLVTVILCGAALSASSSSSSPASSSSSPTAPMPLSSFPDRICASSVGKVSCVQVPSTGLDPSELQMWQLINEDRVALPCVQETKGRARPLEWDAKLAAVARAHSEEMAHKGFFGHQGADGSAPAVRMSRAGLHWRESGENIAKYPDIAEAEAAFMNEPRFQPNHRANILNPDYTHVGVGVVRGADGMYYITQDFAQLQ